MSPYVTYAVMIIAFIAMLWANQQFKSKGVAWGRPAAGLFGIVAVFFAILALWNSVTQQDRDTKRIMDRENRYTQISYTKLGDYLGAYNEGKTLVVLKANDGTSPDRDKLMMDALNEGLNNRMTVKVVTIGEPMDPENPDAMGMMGPEFMLTAEVFEKSLYENVPGYTMAGEEKDEVLDPVTPGNPRDTVVLSLMGLPMETESMAIWNKKEEERPILALANPQLFGLKDRIRDGFINLVMVTNPDAVYDPDAEIPDNDQVAFDTRYILITDLDVEKKATQYPALFGDGQ